MFKILPHTADIRLYASAVSMDELFRTSLKGMASIQKKDFCDAQDVENNMIEHLEIHSPDQTSLLIDFLSVVLTHSHIQKAVYCEVRIDTLTATTLTGLLLGRKADNIMEDIKAVTYHEAEVRKNQNNTWETVIIFDI